MHEDTNRRHSETFIVKVFPGDGTELIGQIQHVRTGEKYRFRGLDELRSAIERMSGQRPTSVAGGGVA